MRFEILPLQPSGAARFKAVERSKLWLQFPPVRSPKAPLYGKLPRWAHWTMRELLGDQLRLFFFWGGWGGWGVGGGGQTGKLNRLGLFVLSCFVFFAMFHLALFCFALLFFAAVVCLLALHC